MTQTIDLNKTQETIESVLDMLHQGDDILFVRDGQPVARMGVTGTVFLSPPHEDKPFKRIPGLGAGTI